MKPRKAAIMIVPLAFAGAVLMHYTAQSKKPAPTVKSTQHYGIEARTTQGNIIEHRLDKTFPHALGVQFLHQEVFSDGTSELYFCVFDGRKRSPFHDVHLNAKETKELIQGKPDGNLIRRLNRLVL